MWQHWQVVDSEDVATSLRCKTQSMEQSIITIKPNMHTHKHAHKHALTYTIYIHAYEYLHINVRMPARVGWAPRRCIFKLTYCQLARCMQLAFEYIKIRFKIRIEVEVGKLCSWGGWSKIVSTWYALRWMLAKYHCLLILLLLAKRLACGVCVFYVCM